MNKLNAYKKLDGEELVQAFLQSGDERLREQIIEAYAGLVRHIAGRVSLAPNAILSRSDLYQYGIIGLLKALDRYELGNGASFATFAYRRIHGEVIDALRREGGLSRQTIDKLKQLERASSSLRRKTGEEPLAQAVCEEMQISESEYHSLIAVSQLNYMETLFSDSPGDDGDSAHRPERLEDSGQLGADELLYQKGLRKRLEEAIKKLAERERLILAFYFYEEMTLRGIGEVLEISEARVSQLLNSVLLKIRRQIEESD